MGVSVHLVRGNGKYDPDWDHDPGLAGDKQFMDWMQGLPWLRHFGNSTYEAGELFRPASIGEWRCRLPADRPNPDRFSRLFDLLEADPDRWIYISW